MFWVVGDHEINIEVRRGTLMAVSEKMLNLSLLVFF